MVQIITTEDHQPASAAPKLAGKSQGTTLRLAHSAPNATKHSVIGSAAAVTSPANDTLLHFWIEQTSRQLARTVQALSGLAAARSWQEGLEIQNALVSSGFAWLNDGMIRYAAVTNAMVAHSREARASAPAHRH